MAIMISAVLGLLALLVAAYLLLRRISRYARRSMIGGDLWTIGLYEGSSLDRLKPLAGVRNPVWSARQLAKPRFAFVADPFLISAQDRWHLFYEALSLETGLGQIGLATSRDLKDWTDRGIVLAEPFHLSFPHVFEWNGSHFMTPETFQAGAVRLYRASPFPRRWEFVGSLLEGGAFVDPCLVRHDGLWWLFVSNASNEYLFLHFSEKLEGPFEAHPLSPIIRGDARRARPAGPVISDGKRLIRFAQVDERVYGEAVLAFEIVRLTTRDFEEQALFSTPVFGASGRGWNALGMHHACPVRLDGRWVVSTDGNRRASWLERRKFQTMYWYAKKTGFAARAGR